VKQVGLIARNTLFCSYWLA